MRYLVRLSCGHRGITQSAPEAGSYISCWSLAYPWQGCQTPRRVVIVSKVQEPGPQPGWIQPTLWDEPAGAAA